MRAFARRIWFGLRGVDPEAVVVSFRTGDDATARAMAEEAQRLIPDRRHYFVSVGPCDTVDGAVPITLDPGSPGMLWLQLRRALRGLRVGMAPVLFTGELQHAPLRCAAFLLAPRKVLAYNERLERHHLRWSCPLASYLFWRGVPLDRIWLRPGWLWPWRRDRTVRPASTRVVEGRPFSPARGRVAVLSPYVPWPLAHGGAVRIFHLLREGAVTHDIVLLAFAEDDGPDTLGPLRELCARIVLVQKPRYREPRWSTIAPPEVGEYFSPAMQGTIVHARTEYGASLVQAEYTQLAQYGAEILVEHDITFDLYRQVHARHPTRAAWWDWWRWDRFERAALRQARRVVVMSSKDALLCGRQDAVVIPNGVDLDRFTPSPEPADQRLLFIGSFRHFPNVLAYRFLIEEVWPALARRFPDLKLTSVTGPTPLLYWRQVTGKRAIPVPDGVLLLEYVADVKPLYDEANLVLVPTPVSAGTNVKVLEAIAMQRAVVSTPSGCAGLGLVHGVSVWIAEGADAFGEAVSLLLEDGAVRMALAQAARRHAERNFSWKRIGALQRNLWAELAPPPLQLRPVRRDDLTAVARIQAASPEASQWQLDSYLESHCVVAEQGGEIAGVIAWRTTTPGEHEILNLAVDPAWRRRGVAARLVESVIEGRPGDWFLEVRESNEAGRNLYERLGFAAVGKRSEYYSTSHEAGIVMRRRS